MHDKEDPIVFKDVKHMGGYSIHNNADQRN
jgi:hypothetical protein